MKRSFDSLDSPELRGDEAAAEEEIAAAAAASAAAPAEQMISGISGSGVKSPVHCEILASVPRPAQYKVPAGEPLLFTYFAIQGLGEVRLLRLLLFLLLLLLRRLRLLPAGC